MQESKNHHFVPEYFLSSWLIPESSKKEVWRYKKICNGTKLETKARSIKSIASSNYLYKVFHRSGDRNVEDGFLRKLDQLGSNVINKLRSTSFEDLSEVEKQDLAITLVGYEARIPETLQEISFESTFPRVRKPLVNDGGLSESSLDATMEEMLEIENSGALTFEAIMKSELGSTPVFDKPFSKGLRASFVKEFRLADGSLVTSNFPMGRVGHYNQNFFYAINITPNRSLFYCQNSMIAEAFFPSHLNDFQIANILNFMVIGKATEVYANNKSDTLEQFTDTYLGWHSNCQNDEEVKAQFANTLAYFHNNVGRTR